MRQFSTFDQYLQADQYTVLINITLFADLLYLFDLMSIYLYTVRCIVKTL